MPFWCLLVKCLKRLNAVKNLGRNISKKNSLGEKENERNFQMANKCHICNKLYTRKDNWVRDHCDITCSVNYRLTQKIPVIFHDYRGYDSVTHRISYNSRN